MERIIKPCFAVIGKAGSTDMGEGFVQRLWEDANSHFDEVAHLAKRNPDGSLSGIWGAMTDFSRSFMPWTDGFSRGLYLAGVEVSTDAQPSEGWTKWIVPGFEYIRVRADGENVFAETIAALESDGIPLAGAVQDFTDPASGIGYMLFPVRRQEDNV